MAFVRGQGDLAPHIRLARHDAGPDVVALGAEPEAIVDQLRELGREHGLDLTHFLKNEREKMPIVRPFEGI